MANTLAEYKYLGDDADIRLGIAQTIVKVSPWLRELPFVEINNNVSRYKMETAEAAADTYEAGDTWVEGTPTWESRDAPLAILGGDADVDNFGELASEPDKAMASVIALKAKAVGHRFEKLCIYGQTTSVTDLSATKNFKGLLRLIAECEGSSVTDLDGHVYNVDPETANNKQVLFAASGASAALTLVMFDALVDAVRPAPTHLVMSRFSRRKLMSLAQTAGENLEHDKGQLGYPVTKYGEQIVLIDDQLKDNMDDSSTLVTAIASYDYNQTSTTAKDGQPIFAVRFGEDGLCGINGAGMIQTVRINNGGDLETKDAKRTRIKAYLGLRLTNKLAAAVLLNGNYAG